MLERTLILRATEGEGALKSQVEALTSELVSTRDRAGKLQADLDASRSQAQANAKQAEELRGTVAADEKRLADADTALAAANALTKTQTDLDAALALAPKPGPSVVVGSNDAQQQEVVSKALGIEFPSLPATKLVSNLGSRTASRAYSLPQSTPNSVAAERGLRAGDVIEETNHQAVERPADFVKAIESAMKNSKKPALLLVTDAEGMVRFVALPVN